MQKPIFVLLLKQLIFECENSCSVLKAITNGILNTNSILNTNRSLDNIGIIIIALGFLCLILPDNDDNDDNGGDDDDDDNNNDNDDADDDNDNSKLCQYV